MAQGVCINSNNKLLLVTIIVVTAGYLTGFVSAGTVVLVREHHNWTEARDRCTEDLNGTLANVDIRNPDTKNVLQNCMVPGDRTWLGNHSVVSPLIVMEGCFSRDVVPPSAFSIVVVKEGTPPSVARCQRRCQAQPGENFGVQGSECLCFIDSSLAPSNLTVGNCDILCDQNAHCGGRESLSLYTVVNRTEQVFLNQFCATYFCLTSGHSSFGYESCHDEYQGVCESGIATNTTLTWWDAQKYCIKQSKWPLTIEQPCTSLTKPSVKYWFGEFRSEEFLSVKDADTLSPVRASVIVGDAEGGFHIEAKDVSDISSFYLCETFGFNSSSVALNISVCGDIVSTAVTPSLGIHIGTTTVRTRFTLNQSAGTNAVGLIVGACVVVVLLIGIVVTALVYIQRKRSFMKRSALYADPEVTYSAVTSTTDASGTQTKTGNDGKQLERQDNDTKTENVYYSKVSNEDINDNYDTAESSQKPTQKFSEENAYDRCHGNIDIDLDPAYDSTRTNNLQSGVENEYDVTGSHVKSTQNYSEENAYDRCHGKTDIDLDPAYDSTRANNIRSSVENAYDVTGGHDNQTIEGHYDTSEHLKEGVYDHSVREHFTEERLYEST